jgi:hypothetical protein
VVEPIGSEQVAELISGVASGRIVGLSIGGAGDLEAELLCLGV